MIDWNEIGIIPLTDARGITKVFNWPSHKGLDIGWWTNQYCPVLTWQDGKVVRRGYGSEVGNYIVMEHIYTEGKRWTGYIHLKDYPNVSVGQSFKMGEKIGNAKRGNSGNSNGTHLHIYFTKIVPQTTSYTWDTMLANCIDPLSHLYYDKQFNTEFISTAWGRAYPEKIAYPSPEIRDETKHQCEIKSSTRLLRNGPGSTYESYDDYCTEGIYDVLEKSKFDGTGFMYWAKIGDIDNNVFWVAVKDTEDLPITDYKVLYEKEIEKNKKIEEANKALAEEKDAVSQRFINAQVKLLNIRTIANEEV